MFFHRFRSQGGLPFHSMFWFLPVSPSGWFVVSKAVAASSGVAFRSARSFEGCCGFHWLRFQGGLQLQKLFSVSSGVVLRAARCFKYCFGFIVFGFWAVSFSTLAVNFAANMAFQWDRAKARSFGSLPSF